MAKPKLTLTASPTFKAIVGIPVAGGADVPVEFTFTHRNADEYDAWAPSLKGRDPIDTTLDIVTAWDLDDPFNRENVEKLLKEYIGSGRAIFEKYIAENTGAKAGN
jgi:hypothetical protein